MEENKSCKNCKHFYEYATRPGYGDCQLNPPQVFCSPAGDTMSKFPYVTANTICGQYRSAAKAAAKAAAGRVSIEEEKLAAWIASHCDGTMLHVVKAAGAVWLSSKLKQQMYLVK